MDYEVKEFERDFEMDKEINIPIKELMEKLNYKYKFDYNLFIDETGMSPQTFNNIVHGIKVPHIKTLVAFCIIYKIDVKNAIDILRAWGYGFKPGNKVHHAYIKLLENYSGEAIDVCNEYLKKIEIEEKYWLPCNK